MSARPSPARAALVAGAARWLPLIGLLAAGLALRLLVWRWHAPYPLGGDESEYFNQALTLLREHRYVELKLMRPPLYTGFLAACIYLFDSLVQRLRLIQELISALTIIPIYALTNAIFGERRVALVAALLAAASYTLAANATELLTETLFLLGLTVVFWLLLRAASGEQMAGRAALAGAALGALALLRSVALPLLPLGALWLLMGAWDEGRRTKDEGQTSRTPRMKTADDFTTEAPRRQAAKTPRLGGKILALNRPSARWVPAAAFALGFLLIVLPWTVRNQLTYDAPILIDTTGPENLWLDNDPAGREAVKRQLYALGDDRAGRQRLALNRGVAAITGDPGSFAAKAWGEAQKFFALQYFDDLRDRRAIWVPPAEVWLRLLLGDGAWLALLIGGIVGMWLAPRGRGLADPRWLFAPWALYTLLTALLFHVELRYRLPLYPALLPYAAWASAKLPGAAARVWRALRSPLAYAAALTCLLALGLTLLHRPYIAETWTLAWKHARLWQAERALAAGDARSAQQDAQAALAWDGDSALARVDLARAALAQGDAPGALRALDAARQALPAHPYAHLLRGAILRAQGQGDAARAELGYETASLEDLQGWAARTFAPVATPPQTLDVGGGLDLGYIAGFSAAEPGGFRWSGATSSVTLGAPGGAARLDLRLAPGRPPGAPPAAVELLIGGRALRRITLADGWRTYSLPIDLPAGPLELTLRSDTFRPRDYDPASPDDRALGVMVGRVAIVPAGAAPR